MNSETRGEFAPFRIEAFLARLAGRGAGRSCERDWPASHFSVAVGLRDRGGRFLASHLPICGGRSLLSTTRLLGRSCGRGLCHPSRGIGHRVAEATISGESRRPPQRGLCSGEHACEGQTLR
jgi:hypothetical protein